MSKLVLGFLMLSASSVFAQDLTLPGEKWIAKFTNYVCVAFGPSVRASTELESFKVKFEQITTDSTLDNGLIKATFEEGNSVCRYSAIVLADNAAATMKLVESKAYATTGDSDCITGKAMLDQNFVSNNYLYYGHPHNLSIMIPAVGAEAVCNGEKFLGVNFVVSGRI